MSVLRIPFQTFESYLNIYKNSYDQVFASILKNQLERRTKKLLDFWQVF